MCWANNVNAIQNLNACQFLNVSMFQPMIHARTNVVIISAIFFCVRCLLFI